MLVVVDNCGVPARVTDEVAARLKARAGLPRAVRGLLVAHPLRSRPGWHHPLHPRSRRSRWPALADRGPALLALARGGSVGFAANQRVLKDGGWVAFGVNPHGPVDHSLPVLCVTDPDGKVWAVLAGFACHCTTLGGEFNKVCGDWAGYFYEAIEHDHPGARQATREVARAEVGRLLKGSMTPLPHRIVAVEPGPLGIRDRNFRVRTFLFRIRRRGTFFLVRRHESTLPFEPTAPLRPVGRGDTGEVFEQTIWVVRRLDPWDVCERPRAILHLEDLEARRRRRDARAPRPVPKGLLDLPPQPAHPLLQHPPFPGPVAHPVPVAEPPIRQRQQPPSDRLTIATPVHQRLKVAPRTHQQTGRQHARTQSDAPKRSPPTTGPSRRPKRAWAIAPRRCLAMVKTVKQRATVAPDHAFRRSSRHDVSSMWTTAA